MKVKQQLLTLIDKFLAERRESAGGGWAPVTEEDESQLTAIIALLIKEKWGTDADGDRPIEYGVVNRTKFMRVQYGLVPYYWTKQASGTDEKLAGEVLRLNLRISLEELTRYMQDEQLRLQLLKPSTKAKGKAG